MVAIDGPGGSSGDTTVRPNDVYRRVLVFFLLFDFNSGVYTCQVMVDGTTVKSATAAMNVAGKLLIGTCRHCMIPIGELGPGEEVMHHSS